MLRYARHRIPLAASHLILPPCFHSIPPLSLPSRRPTTLVRVCTPPRTALPLRASVSSPSFHFYSMPTSSHHLYSDRSHPPADSFPSVATVLASRLHTLVPSASSAARVYPLPLNPSIPLVSVSPVIPLTITMNLPINLIRPYSCVPVPNTFHVQRLRFHPMSDLVSPMILSCTLNTLTPSRLLSLFVALHPRTAYLPECFKASTGEHPASRSVSLSSFMSKTHALSVPAFHGLPPSLSSFLSLLPAPTVPPVILSYCYYTLDSLHSSVQLLT
jgi:hypothetical protein